MLNSPINVEEALTAVSESIKYIVGTRENASWHHGHVNGMISAFTLMGVFEKKHVRMMNVAADEALEKITTHIPKEDI
jgi:hypothetical protein